MGILVFASYSTKDTELFHVSRIAESLTQYSEIDDVLYWEEDLYDDIFEYMNKNIKKCDIFILFCSENIEKSEPINMEWMTALKLKKKIIPVFLEEEHIPPLLSTKYGIHFDRNNIEKIIVKLYRLILKKYELRKKSSLKVKKPEIFEETKPLDKQFAETINPRLRLVGDYYIKKFVMSGFASYGDRTINVKLSPNITCIVGPNESGKSNFIKAILFALDFFKDSLYRVSDVVNLIYRSYRNNKDSAKEASVTLQFDNIRGFFPNYPFFNLTRTIQKDSSDIRKINEIIVSDSEYKNALSITDLDADTLNSQKFFLDTIKIGEFINANPKDRLKYVGRLIGAYNIENNNWNPDRFKENFILIKEQLYKLFLKFYPEESVEIFVDNEKNLSQGELYIKVKKFGVNFISFEEMSGGGKVFTFLLLYFAILKSFPSSIYIFDEIDGTLDFVTLQKLRTILREFASKSQIIIVTHQEETISYSDLIYGVAKKQDWITDIFTVDLKEEIKIEKEFWKYYKEKED